jgi:hypothetical protein
MNRREELLLGVKSLNRRKINEGNTSEEAQETERERVEGESDKRIAVATGGPGARIPTDQRAVQANEASLESILKAQVDGKSEALQALELEIADCEHELKRLMAQQLGLKYDIQTAVEVLGRAYADNPRDRNAKDPVPQAGPGLKNEAKENK